MTKIETIYLIHHSHTDIGFTMDQPIVWEMHTRFIDQALDLAEKYAASDTDGAFRWTVETTAVLQKWLQGASARDIDRFTALERAGRVEVTGMFVNITPLLDADELIESFQILRSLREDYGFTIRHAMNCDVNGENWPLVDLLLDLGIEGFTMAINSHFGGALQPRPLVFNWQGPSGRTIPVNNGWPYDKGWREGIGRDADDLANVRLPRLQEYLDVIGYSLPIVLLQSFHPYGDNGSAFDFTPFIDQWNASGRGPRIVMATPAIWWNAVRQHADQLKSYRGDWTDFWNFGAGSSAVETAVNRDSRVRLRSADAIYAGLRAVAGGKWAQQSFERYRKDAWESLFLWDEHTWGADIAIRKPGSIDTYSQWNYKAAYAYRAHSLSLLLQRDALADFAQQVTRQYANDLLVFNPLPWERSISGDITRHITSPRGLASDTTAGRHAQDRDEVVDFVLPPTRVPALGYTVVSRDTLIPVDTTPKFSEDGLIENERYRLTFDRERGGIASLYDKQLDCEWIDSSAGYPFNGYVHEQVADQDAPFVRHLLFQQDWDIPLAEIPAGWQTGWRAHRRGVRRLLSHKVYHTPLGVRVVQELEGDHRKITQTVFLPNHADTIECVSSWEMGLTAHPEATYLAFPFNLSNATARYDLGSQAVVPGADQLPGVCRDYFTTQGWVDFSNAQRGVTVAMPDTPLVQFGDFHFGHYQMNFHLERSLLLGWVTNNYWETNFRAHQPGKVTARYVILPHDGTFDEAKAHQFGLEVANSAPVIQHLGEQPAASTPLPSSASLLTFPAMPVLTLHVKEADDGDGLIVRLLNASDQPQTAQIGSALLTITGAQQCDLLENEQGALTVTNGSVSVEVPPRRVVVVGLQTQSV